MKLILNRSDLANKLSIAKKMTASRPILPSTAHFLLEGKNNHLVIKSTDTQVSSNLVLEAEISGNTTNQVSLPADLFSGIISNLNSEEVELEFLKDNCKVVGGKAKATVKGLPVEDFPQLPSGSHKITALSRELVEIINNLFVPFVVQDESSDIFQGVWIWCKDNILRMTAKDRCRISYWEQPFKSENFAVNVPAKGRCIFKEVSGQVELWLSENKKHLILVADNGVFSTTLLPLPEPVPDIRSTLPLENATTEIQIDANKLKVAIRLLSLFANTNTEYRRVNLETRTNEDGLFILSEEKSNAGNGLHKVDCTKLGNELDICINAKFLDRILDALSGDTVTIYQFGNVVLIKTDSKPELIHGISLMTKTGPVE